MCGICGIVDWLYRPVDEGLLVRMRDLMSSRGPDDAGTHTELGVGLAHRRLSIIDLSAAGHQPMSNEDGSIWIVFNGEIYNFLELRAELVGSHPFKSRTDTEVLLHGYEQWGMDGLLRRLRGMFALAIWDSKKRQLHLGRDHLGKKPLFYHATEGRLAFASDIKCLALAAEGRLEINEQALDEYLYYSTISQARTIYRGVNKLPPAHYATFGDGRVRAVRYWQPDYTKKEARSTGEWLEGVDHYLRQAVKRRLISDVPLGGFLSGGVDSSAVCALMAKEGTTPPRTFSVSFGGDLRFDEREYSRKVAKHIRSRHTELDVQPDVAPILSNLVWQYGEPYGDSSMIPTYLISQEARKYVTVVLTGDGGDEAFAGYSRHLRADLSRQHERWPALVTQGVLPAAARLVNRLFPQRLMARNFDLWSKYVAGDTAALSGDTCWFEGLRRGLYTPKLMAKLDDAGFHPLAFAQKTLLANLRGPTAVDRALEALLQSTLPNDYLVKVDVATMAHSLEARCPFLDVDLLEFAMTIPSALLVQGKTAKSLLKRYAATLVPPEVIYRKKHGFAVPIRNWFRNEWREPLGRLLLSKQADRGYFKPAFVAKVLDDHAAGKINHSSRIWTLLVLEIWNRLFVDRTLQPGDPVLV